MKNIAILLRLLIDLIDRTAAISALLKRARDEGRDVTDEELNEYRAKDDIASDRLESKIAEKRAQAEAEVK